MPGVYLCGPITGATLQECKFGWRQHVFDQLLLAGINSWSPMRHKIVFSEEDQKSMSPMGSDLSVLTTPRGLTERDRYDTIRSDLVFCNLLGAKRVSIGSMIELGWADSNRIPVVLCMEPDNLHNHAMVRETVSWIVPTLEEAIEITKAVLTPSI